MMFEFFFEPKYISKMLIFLVRKKWIALFMTRLSLKLAGQGMRRRPGAAQRLGGTWVHCDPEAGDSAC